MIVFSFTEKVRDKLDKHKEIKKDNLDSGRDNWYVDLIRIDRKEHFLFTNSISLYNLIVYVGTVNEKKNIESIFKSKLVEAVREDFGDLSENWIKRLSNESEFLYTKTNSRKILGSMNDYKWQIEVQRHYNELGVNEVNTIRQRLNDCPMSLFDYSSGEKEMERLMIDYQLNMRVFN